MTFLANIGHEKRLQCCIQVAAVVTTPDSETGTYIVEGQVLKSVIWLMAAKESKRKSEQVVPPSNKAAIVDRSGRNQSTARILVADDDPLSRKVLQRFLNHGNHEAIVAQDGVEAMELMDDDVSVALLDLNMPRASGMDVLQFIREEFADAQVIMVSGEGEIQDAVAAMKAGACDYITKPVDSDELLATVALGIDRAGMSRENRGLREAVGGTLPAKQFAAHSDVSRHLLNQVTKVAPLDSSVLLTGESGTGKSTLARLIHQHGPRHEGPFVSVNCASLPRDLIEAELFGHSKGAFTGASGDRPGRIEIAHGGTLFLDEIGDLPLELQPKLLTFLQDRTIQRIGSNTVIDVDVRIIAATHQNLAEMCQSGRFRQDLFYRLNVLNLVAPALRERREDILPVANDVLNRISARRGTPQLALGESARTVLLQHGWPGNVRELENVLERASVFCDGPAIEASDLELPDSLALVGCVTEVGGAGSFVGMTLAELERRAIKNTLAHCEGNKAKTARVLGISEKSIYNKMRRLGMR